jgi:GNAT superfamily N-acetyltransferase
MIIFAAIVMKLVHWVRFSWDLDKLPAIAPALPLHYRFDEVSSSNERDVRAVIARSLAHDMSWVDAIHEVSATMEGWLERVFDPEKDGVCVALRHGSRIIGATILNPNPAADDHLAPGPCVQMEYRSRGLGTALLAEGLRRLQEAGLSRAATLARLNGPAAKFLYPKFGGAMIPATTPLLAA